MRLIELTCRNFRSLVDVRFEPAAGLNVIRGGNAQGKTSLLEAMFYLATSKSHRTNSDIELVRYGEDGFRVTARFYRRDREVAIEAIWLQGIKRFKINGIPQARMSDLLGKAHVVMFSNEDLALVRGSASHRRRFMDMEMSQLNAAYLGALQQYRQALRQRNELLRSPEPERSLLEVWDHQLAAHGALLMRARAAFIQELNALAEHAYASVAGAEEFEIIYEPNVETEQSLQVALAKATPTDLRRGMTTRGPHRDEVLLNVSGRSARDFASQGQQKTAAVAVKLAEMALIKARTGEFPLLLLDEVLSELDEARSRRLFSTIPAEVQCIMAAADMAGGGVPGERAHRCFRMEQGHLEEE